MSEVSACLIQVFNKLRTDVSSLPSMLVNCLKQLDIDSPSAIETVHCLLINFCLTLHFILLFRSSYLAAKRLSESYSKLRSLPTYWNARWSWVNWKVNWKVRYGF